MKNPFFRWLVIQATSMVPTTPAPASGVRKPTSSSAPAPISVRVASQACRTPGFIPRFSNHRPVAAIFPPRKTWLFPLARKTKPSTTRSRSNAMLTATASGIGPSVKGYHVHHGFPFGDKRRPIGAGPIGRQDRHADGGGDRRQPGGRAFGLPDRLLDPVQHPPAAGPGLHLEG